MDKTTDSILVSIKKMLGLDDDYGPFDTDVIVQINSALMTLNQLGVGSPGGFMVTDYTQTWSQFLTNPTMLEAAKNYVYLSVKLMFDPPTNSSVQASMEKQLEQLGWRLNVQAESVETFDFITDDEKARRRGWPGNDVIDPYYDSDYDYDYGGEDDGGPEEEDWNPEDPDDNSYSGDDDGDTENPGEIYTGYNEEDHSLDRSAFL